MATCPRCKRLVTWEASTAAVAQEAQQRPQHREGMRGPARAWLAVSGVPGAGEGDDARSGVPIEPAGVAGAERLLTAGSKQAALLSRTCRDPPARELGTRLPVMHFALDPARWSVGGCCCQAAHHPLREFLAARPSGGFRHFCWVGVASRIVGGMPRSGQAMKASVTGSRDIHRRPSDSGPEHNLITPLATPRVAEPNDPCPSAPLRSGAAARSRPPPL
jgi:hypothetical protein